MIHVSSTTLFSSKHGYNKPSFAIMACHTSIEITVFLVFLTTLLNLARPF